MFVGKMLGYVVDPSLKQFPITYSAYKLWASSLERPVVGCFRQDRLDSSNYEAAAKVMYQVHRLYLVSHLTSNQSLTIGYPCSLQLEKNYPAKYLVKELLHIAENYVDNSSFVSLAENEVRARLVETLEFRFVSLLGLTQISGTTAYTLLIAFGAACGGEFEPEIYKLCVEYLAKALDGLDFEKRWNASKTSFLIEMISCLLPNRLLQKQFEVTVAEYCSDYAPMDCNSAASVCYIELLKSLEIKP